MSETYSQLQPEQGKRVHFARTLLLSRRRVEGGSDAVGVEFEFLGLISKVIVPSELTPFSQALPFSPPTFSYRSHHRTPVLLHFSISLDFSAHMHFNRQLNTLLGIYYSLL